MNLIYNIIHNMEESLEDLKDESISNANRFELVEKTK